MIDASVSSKDLKIVPAGDSTMAPVSSSISADLDRFQRLGYLVIPAVFSPQEIIVWRQRIESVLSEQEQGGIVINPPGAKDLRIVRGELANIESIRPIVLDPRITALARQILGGNVVYYGDSSIHFGNRDPLEVSQEGLHRDCPGRQADPENLVWGGEYPLIRFGIYFQDHRTHSGGLSIVPGSHADPEVKGPKIPVEAEPGDLIVWNQRALHVGHTARDGMQPDGVRLALFVSFAQESAQLEHYLGWMGGRSGWMGDRVIQDRWRSTVQDQPFLDALNQAGVTYHSPLSSIAETQ